MKCNVISHTIVAGKAKIKISRWTADELNALRQHWKPEDGRPTKTKLESLRKLLPNQQLLTMRVQCFNMLFLFINWIEFCIIVIKPRCMCINYILLTWILLMLSFCLSAHIAVEFIVKKRTFMEFFQHLDKSKRLFYM